jgi:tRNA G10  N-methylase Trm11
MRQRTYKKVSLPASLKPTIAYAMVALSRPRDDDEFLDPMCGAGTILLERAHAGRYQLLLGGDVDAEAVAATLENFGPRHKPFEIQTWDARELPLVDDSVSAIVTNMPFGRQIGTTEENRILYPALIAEWVRVLRAGGRMVLLTSEHALLRRVLRSYPGLVAEGSVPIIVRGFPAAIYTLRLDFKSLEVT